MNCNRRPGNWFVSVHQSVWFQQQAARFSTRGFLQLPHDLALLWSALLFSRRCIAFHCFYIFFTNYFPRMRGLDRISVNVLSEWAIMLKYACGLWRFLPSSLFPTLLWKSGLQWVCDRVIRRETLPWTETNTRLQNISLSKTADSGAVERLAPGKRAHFYLESNRCCLWPPTPTHFKQVGQ